MTQNKNKITSLPFYTDLNYQDRNKWWVDRVHRLISPNNKFLPFQIIKDITLVGGVTCPVPTTVDYTADFTTGVDGWVIESLVGDINAVLSWDSINQRVKIEVTSNVGDTFFGVVVTRANTGQNYQYNAGNFTTQIRGTNGNDEISAYSIPGAEDTYPTGTYDISSGYTLIDGGTRDTSYNKYGLYFTNANASATTFYIESYSASSTPYLKIDENTVYQSNFSSSIDNWYIFGGGSAVLSNPANELSLLYNSDTQVTVERNVSYTPSSPIRRLTLRISADQGVLYSFSIIGETATGTTFSRLVNANHNFDLENDYIYDVENGDNWGQFERISLRMQPNGNLTTNFTDVEFTTLEECQESNPDLWTAAFIVNAETGSTTDVTTYMNDNTGISTHDNYQIAIYDASVNLASSIAPGLYYLSLNDGTTTYYSEVFSPCANLDGYLKIEWWRDTDLLFDNGRIVYQGGYINTIYLDTDIGRPNVIYEIEETERDGFKFIEKTVTYDRYRFEAILPEVLVFVLSRLPNHEYITINYNDELFTVQKIEILDPEWEEQADLAVLGIEFETNTIISSGTRISGAVNELNANATEAINIRGNNKRIYQLSDPSDLTDVYIPVDKDTFSEAGRILLTTLLGAGGSLAVENKTARNSIPQNLRSKHIVVSYDNNTEKYISSDLSDIAWTNDDNWVDVESFYVIVDDVAARDAIVSNKRREGLIVHTKSPYAIYQLVGGTTNADFLELKIPLTYPAETIPDGTSNYYIVVGGVADNEVVKIDYQTKRNGNIEFGELGLTNLSDTLIRRSAFGANGLTIAKNIDSGNIRLDITDDLANGFDIEIKLTIRRY